MLTPSKQFESIDQYIKTLPLIQPMPYDLIKKIAVFQVEEILKKKK